MNNKHVNLIADSIVYAVQNQKPKLTAILLKNGVVIPTGTKDSILILLVSDVFKKSKPFRNDFLDLISKTEYVSSSSFDGYSNATGFEASDFYVPEEVLFAPNVFTTNSPLTTPSILNTTSTTPASSQAPASSTSFWSTNNLMGLFNKAADTYATISTNQANTALANAATVRAQTGATDGTSTGLSSAPIAKSNTTMYLIIAVVAIGAIGGIIWYNKSKK